jgi:hypothetical protein
MVIKALIELIADADTDRGVRSAVAEALRGRPESSVTSALIMLARDADTGVRWAAMNGLRGRPGSKVTKALVALSRDADTGLRWAAADALGGRPGSKVTNALITLAGDAATDGNVRGVAEQELALRIDPTIIQWFVLLSSKRSAEPPTSMQVPDEINLWYRTAIAIANNSRSWPAGERDRLIDALAKYTVAVTASREDR